MLVINRVMNKSIKAKKFKKSFISVSLNLYLEFLKDYNKLAFLKS